MRVTQWAVSLLQGIQGRLVQKTQWQLPPHTHTQRAWRVCILHVEGTWPGPRGPG